MSNIDYERLHAGIIKTVIEDPIFCDEAKLVSFRDSDSEQRVAYINSSDEPNVNLVVGLPETCDKIFMTVTDGDTAEVGRIVAELESAIAGGKEIQNQHIVRFESEYLISQGVTGVIILPIRVSPALSHIPLSIELLGKKFVPHLLVFVSEKEYRIWKELGANELMDYFDESDKDLISIKQ